MSTPGPREIWRWPLWSWSHLAITVVAVIAVLAGLGQLTSAREKEAAPTAPALSQGLGSSSQANEAAAAAASTASAPYAIGAVDVSVAFVGVWARPGAPSAGWRADCAWYATEAFGRVLASATPDTVPASRVVGPGTLDSLSGSRATVRVPTDGGAVLVDVVELGAGWKVNDIAPETSPLAVTKAS